MMGSEIEVKTERLVEMLGQSGLNGVLLNGQHNFAWITGGSDNGVDRSRDSGAASILVTASGKRFLLASNIEMPRMLAEQVSADDLEPIEFPWQEEKASADFLTATAARIAGGKVASDILLNSKTPTIDGYIADCRYSLTMEEIARYAALGKDASSAIDRVAFLLAPGMTELVIAEIIRQEMARHRIESVVTLVAADERISRFRHPVPTQKAWKQTLLLVTCARRHGLIVSLSRIVCLNRAPEELIERTEAAAFVYATLLAATRPGNTARELYETAARAYSGVGFAGEIDLHHQGGAAGYRTRDWVAHPSNSATVRENQAFAWNPTITGTKVEDTVLLTESGIEPVTQSGPFPSITNVIGGIEFISAGILRI